MTLPIAAGMTHGTGAACLLPPSVPPAGCRRFFLFQSPGAILSKYLYFKKKKKIEMLAARLS
jgi:hypothetical protein